MDKNKVKLAALASSSSQQHVRTGFFFKKEIQVYKQHDREVLNAKHLDVFIELKLNAMNFNTMVKFPTCCRGFP